MTAHERPNILLITTDQQRYDTTGPRAPSFLRTPHFDDLARQGITFRCAYADGPLCVPARVSMMTGKYVATHGLHGNGKTSEVMGTEETMPGHLRRLGYTTAAIGKMHFGPARARHGFEEMLLPDDYYKWINAAGLPYKPMRHGLGQNELTPGMATVPECLTLTSWIAEQCVDYIHDRRDPTRPFFLWCSFSKPHPPLDPPEPYYSMYRDADIPAPIESDWCDDEHIPEPMKRFRQCWSLDTLTPEVLREARAAYYGLITQIDYNIGRVLSALQDEGLFNDTLIVYTSDHGEFLGDHRMGAKSFFHEPSAHVPFLVRLPKSWDDRRHGTSCDAPVTHADILPTLLRAAGGDVPDDMDGLDLVGVARGQVEPRPYVVSVQRGGAITDGRWKYLYFPEGASEQLFDLENDPQEATNLAAAGKAEDQRTRLRQALIDWLAQRDHELLVDGDLRVDPLAGDSETDRRNGSWPGYHTEACPADVKH